MGRGGGEKRDEGRVSWSVGSGIINVFTILIGAPFKGVCEHACVCVCTRILHQTNIAQNGRNSQEV